MITKKEVDEDIQVDPNLLFQFDPNLLYQSPDVEQFYPDAIRRFSLGRLIPSSVPLTNQGRRRTVVQEFKKKFRFVFVIFAVISLLDIFIAGYLSSFHCLIFS